ncbi:MAG TPA: DUF1203 domain-containing protein, partial [Pseudonocardia sp.]|nr:DUF1203 domain-containing protein [Pseudonocardia sp.]
GTTTGTTTATTPASLARDAIALRPLPSDTGSRALAAGHGAAGEPVVVRTDLHGVPLRCCLRDSRVGERVALVAVVPPGPRGAYRETGPVFVHADDCGGPGHRAYPEDWRRRTQVFRAYDAEGRIVGGSVVPAGDGQERAAAELLADPAVAFLHTRNVVHGCYLAMIERA